MSQELILIDSETEREAGRAELDGNDVIFPDEFHGWTDVMDCRHAPYTDQSLEENCHIASHVRKPYILITSDQFEVDEPTETDAA